MLRVRIISILILLMIANGIRVNLQRSSCLMDVAFNVEHLYTEVYVDCELIGYLFDNDYETITSDKGTVYVIVDERMHEVYEIVQSENGHIYSTIDMGGLHDIAIPISDYTLNYFKG